MYNIDWVTTNTQIGWGTAIFVLTIVFSVFFLTVIRYWLFD